MKRNLMTRNIRWGELDAFEAVGKELEIEILSVFPMPTTEYAGDVGREFWFWCPVHPDVFDRVFGKKADQAAEA